MPSTPAATPPPPAAVRLIVVRAWHEDGGGFRARLTVVRDLDDPEEHAKVVGSADEAVELVRAWLADLAG